MITLADYARQQFPDYRITGDGADRPLRSHTAIVQVVGRHHVDSIADGLRRRYGGDVATVTMRSDHAAPDTPDHDDQDGIASLPAKRPALAGLALGIPVGIVVGLIVGFATEQVAVGIIVGIFSAILATWVAGLFGGGGRFAGERAWEQVRAPDATIGLVAVLVDDERSAVAALESVDHSEVVDTRVVDDHGTWHAPNSFA